MKGERGKEGEMEKKGQLESMVKFKQMERMGGGLNSAMKR